MVIFTESIKDLGADFHSQVFRENVVVSSIQALHQKKGFFGNAWVWNHNLIELHRSAALYRGTLCPLHHLCVDVVELLRFQISPGKVRQVDDLFLPNAEGSKSGLKLRC